MSCSHIEHFEDRQINSLLSLAFLHFGIAIETTTRRDRSIIFLAPTKTFVHTSCFPSGTFREKTWPCHQTSEHIIFMTRKKRTKSFQKFLDTCGNQHTSGQPLHCAADCNSDDFSTVAISSPTGNGIPSQAKQKHHGSTLSSTAVADLRQKFGSSEAGRSRQLLQTKPHRPTGPKQKHPQTAQSAPSSSTS